MSEDIIINAVSPRVRYIADGKATSFSFVFPIFSNQDMNVYIDDELITNGYSVVGAGTTEGGEVIFNTAPANGQIITLIRNLEIKRTSDFQESGAFRAKAINHELDYQIACLQQLNEQIGRSVSFPPYSGSAQSVNLPEPEIGKAIVWAENGTSLRNSNLAYDDLEQLMIDTQTTVLAAEQNVINKENLAQNHEQNATTSKEEARKWAVGTIQEQPSGSAKYWAENAKAMTDGTLNETQITNCITKIPQDIKLELSNGTLTLKAGSKVYIPNGAGVFKEILINSDISLTDTTNYNNLFVFYIDGRLERILSTQVFSGTDAPSGTNFLYWYDTKNNLIKRTTDGGSNWTSGNISFPLGLFSTNGTGFSSIDQVFNGFGYIGRTIFSLPGAEGLIPSGRNTDGSLNNAKFMTTKVTTINNGVSLDNAILAYFTGTSVLTLTYSQNYYHNNQENYNYFNGIKTAQFLLFGTLNADSTGRVTSFSPKLPVKLADNQEVVHKTGNETIEGEKIFTSNITVSNPNGVSIMQCVDPANTNNNAKIQYYVGDNSASFANVQNGSTIGGIRIDNSGYAYSIKPPVATDKSTQIATTQWVRNYGAQVNYSAGITISSGATASTNGLLVINENTGGGFHNGNLKINSVTVAAWTGLDGTKSSEAYPVKSGDKIEFTSVSTAILYPYV